MVRTLNPPTPRTPQKSHSEVILTDHEKRIEAELAQLVIDIRRIGPTFPEPSPHVLFGELFDDEAVEQYYEALVGTLKSAKKRGIITFKGQMLLKGMHDKVKISIVGADDDEGDDDGRHEKENGTRQPEKITSSRRFSFSSNAPAPSPRKSPIVRRKKAEIAGTCSDTEAEMVMVASRPRRSGGKPLSVLTASAGAASDSEADVPLRPKRSPRGRIVVPLAFSAGNNRIDKSGRPPAPWRIRKAKSEALVTKALSSTTNNPTAKKRIALETKGAEEDAGTNTTTTSVTTSLPVSETTTLSLDIVGPTTKEEQQPKPPKRSPRPLNNKAKAQSVNVLTTQASSRIDDEVHQLVRDISRVGANPGEPSVTFGELFDDDEVQQTYEALVGTLRSAKRQGYIDFQGPMLLKGVHDSVVIHVVESNQG